MRCRPILLLALALCTGTASQNARAINVAGLDYLSAYPNIEDPTVGLNINSYLGAGRFYASGFTGSSAIVANVEAGLIWSNHETLTHLSRTVVAPGALGDVDRHATWVGMILGGRPTQAGGDYQRGMAPGAQLWSSAIATAWIGSPYTRAFDYTVQSLVGGYGGVMLPDANGRAADVVNSSFSDGSDVEAARYGDYSRSVDALAGLTGKVVVCSGGNNGPNGVSGAPGSGFNVIAVGSLGNDLDAVPYNRVSSFSSRGPQAIYVPSVAHADYFTPGDGTVVPAARGVIDLVAPGENIVGALYSGTTGGNRNGFDSFPGETNQYTNGINGSSFATPSVAGGATLLVDAARQIFGTATRATDGRAIKAILLNSADKTNGWTNGQAIGGDGVVRTTQSLDYAAGAGRMNLDKAYDQLLSGTADLPGDAGGTIASIGWDMGLVAQGAPSDYFFTGVLPAGTMLTATLDWFADRTIDLAKVADDPDDNTATAEASFDDLTLQVWRASVLGAASTLVAESSSAYNEVEHLNVALPMTDRYLLRVLWAGEVWDVVNDANQTTFGLAWAAVPEPTGAAIVACALVATACRRRREVVR